MTIMKGLKNNKLTNEDSDEFEVKVKNGCLCLEGKVTTTRYLFDQCSILQVIANELTSNPTLVGSVLKHKD